MEKFDVMHKEKKVGTVSLVREGLFTLLQCKCESFSQIMRLYGLLEDKYIAIGILSPLDDGIGLTKKYSKNDLKTVPVDKSKSFEVYGINEKPKIEKEQMEQKKEEDKRASPWSLVEDAASLFSDPELKETAAGIKGGIMANDGDTILFAIPISSEQPFPLMPVFRYGSSAMIEGKCCIVFRIKDGFLV